MGILYANDVHVDAGRRLLKLTRHGGKRRRQQQQQNLGCILDHQVPARLAFAWVGPLLWLTACLVSSLIFPHLGR